MGNPMIFKMKVTFPYNFSELNTEQQLLFKGRSDYSITSLQINEVKNVFVSHEGLVLKN